MTVDAVYSRVINCKAEDLVPVMACPSNVDNVKPISEIEGKEIDQVFIGSCTNGRLEDLMAAAEILKDKHVAPFVKLIVTPASRKIYRQAVENGTMEILSKAGAIITHPSCGLCCGRTGGILTDGETVVATNNRNFLGRMGTSKVGYLPAVTKIGSSLCNSRKDSSTGIVSCFLTINQTICVCAHLTQILGVNILYFTLCTENVCRNEE